MKFWKHEERGDTKEEALERTIKFYEEFHRHRRKWGALAFEFYRVKRTDGMWVVFVRPRKNEIQPKGGEPKVKA